MMNNAMNRDFFVCVLINLYKYSLVQKIILWILRLSM